MENKTMLNEEIKREFSELAGLQAGTDEHRHAVDDVTKLMDRVIELEKIEADYYERHEARESERELKLQQLKQERRFGVLKTVAEVGATLFTLGVSVWGLCSAFKFEEEGTISSSPGRGIINNFIPKFKR